MSNILVTAIGSYSAEAVIQSLRSNFQVCVVGCDIYPASWVAASVLVDRFYQISISYESENYIKELVRICKKENISHILPLTDPEIDILAMHRHVFEGNSIVLCMTGNSSIGICRDKFTVFEYFRTNSHVNVIPTCECAAFSELEFPFPVIAKPRKGRSSEGVMVFKNADEYAYQHFPLDNYILQPLYSGEVYTADFVRNRKNGKIVSVARKELVRTKNGAGLTVEIVDNETLRHHCQIIGDSLDIHGCVNCEFMFYAGKYYLMDINPRFSAGIAFSLLAGYDMVRNHLHCFMGQDIEDAHELTLSVITRKYVEIIVNQGQA
jgi:carbamoyl-phosphate synthase large subunit